jgi:hypothetical protein
MSARSVEVADGLEQGSMWRQAMDGYSTKVVCGEHRYEFDKLIRTLALPTCTATTLRLRLAIRAYMEVRSTVVFDRLHRRGRRVD